MLSVQQWAVRKADPACRLASFAPPTPDARPV